MTTREPIHLIVNADDYGYFPCISRGILDAAASGSVTATGILANNPNLTSQLEWLNAVDDLDLGIHLNLTYGHPLATSMADKLSTWNGLFPGAYSMSLMLLNKKIDIKDVRAEWCAQIEACQGRKLMFLNSHEHIHMLPALFSLTRELAREYQIPQIRLTRAEWLLPIGISGLVRNTLIQCMQTVNQSRFKVRSPILLGLSRSGKINFDYLAKIFSRLKPGQTYELMCHPGYFDPCEISDHRLKAYHDWENELNLLRSPKLQSLYERFGIRLSHYQE